MTSHGLTSGEEFLRNAAKSYFEDIYEKPKIYVHEELHKDLPWNPAFRFVVHDHINVFVEVSETNPYPQIVQMRLADVQQFPEPIAVYAVCPEEMITKPKQRAEMKDMQAHGYGLLTVNANGQVHREFSACPLIQVIPKAQYKSLINGLPKAIRQHVSQAYEDYSAKPVNGVSKVTEIIEGLVEQAAVDAINKAWISRTTLGNSVADELDAMYQLQQCKNARAAIGGVRSHYSMYRNLNHHWPKNKKKAHEKYTDCRHGFMEGLRNIKQFRDAMKKIGLSGNLKK